MLFFTIVGIAYCTALVIGILTYIGVEFWIAWKTFLRSR